MITSVTNPKVKQVVQYQNKARERRKDGVFLAEGHKMFDEAPLEWIKEVFVSEKAASKLEQGSGTAEKLNRTGYELVSDEVMEKMADTQTPQGILTILKCPQYSEEELLRTPKGLFLILEDLQDPGNLGTIMRTSEGAGVDGIFMSRGTVDIFNPKTVRASMGSIYRVPFIQIDDLQEIMQKMKNNGIHTYAAHLAGREYYTGCSFDGPTAFLIGNEGNGLSKELSEQADSYVKIPMEGQLESLNAAVATALLIYEAKRQRSLT